MGHRLTKEQRRKLLGSTWMPEEPEKLPEEFRKGGRVKTEDRPVFYSKPEVTNFDVEYPIAFITDIKTVSEANVREHWAKRAARHKKQMDAAYRAIRKCGVPKPVLVIALTRVGPRMLDSDNLAGALKGVRDGIAKAFRIDDGSSLVEWTYAQARGKKGEYRVAVEIETIACTSISELLP